MRKVLAVLNKLEFLGIDVNDFYAIRFNEGSLYLQGYDTEDNKDKYCNHAEFTCDSNGYFTGYITIHNIKVNIILAS